MNFFKKSFSTIILFVLSLFAFAQNDKNFIENTDGLQGVWIIAFICIVPLLIIIVLLYVKFKSAYVEKNELAKKVSAEEIKKIMDFVKIKAITK